MGIGVLFGMMVDAGAFRSVLSVTVIPLGGIEGTCTLSEVHRTCFKKVVSKKERISFNSQ